MYNHERNKKHRKSLTATPTLTKVTQGNAWNSWPCIGLPKSRYEGL